MIMNDMPFNQLKLQHRMRPEISKLLVPHIYEELFNDKSVEKYEHIIGIKKNMFFISHSNPESQNDKLKSKSNQFEAEFIVRLCKHLLFQEYKSSKITVLTLYSAQHLIIKEMLSKDKISIDCQVLDGFQGEENDIIIVSFVRSNRRNNIGFLDIPNRVNVALSRAKKGLYCVGNFDSFAKRSKLWTNITKDLRKNKEIGRTLELKCPNHPNVVISVSNAKDFDKKSPFGGCTQPCYLVCGHLCPNKVCHTSATEEVNCSKKCWKKNCSENHLCQHICHFPTICKPCVVKINKIVPKCGHTIQEICSGNMFCYKPCEQTLDCGHKCDKKCGEECQTECQYRCTKTLMCGHNCKLQCYETCDPNSCDVLVERQLEVCGHQMMAECSQDLNALECIEECEQLLLCGHRCEGMCFKCNQSRLHTNCQQKCEQMLICGHKCLLKCYETCDPNSCKVLVQKSLICGHKLMTKCSRDLKTLRCIEKCEQLLLCGHRCEGICYKCNQSRVHTKCQQKCEQIVCPNNHTCPHICHLPIHCKPCIVLVEKSVPKCGHRIKELCSGDMFCYNRCERRLKCLHICDKKCGEKCDKLCRQLIEEVLDKCGHTIQRKCWEHSYCYHSCPTILKCGHKCNRRCGDPCPDKCATNGNISVWFRQKFLNISKAFKK